MLQDPMPRPTRGERDHIRARGFARLVVFFLTLATCGFVLTAAQVLASPATSATASEKAGLPPENAVDVKATVTPSATATVLPLAPTPLSLASAAPNADNTGRVQQPKVESIPVFGSFDFMRGYFANITAPTIVEGKPWDNGSMNFAQYKQPGGGNSYWDYWIDDEPWDSPKHMWRDDQGQWHKYQTEAIRETSGKKVTAYVLVDRPGPGVMDKLWFTHNPVRAFLRLIIQKNLFWSPDPPEVTNWGSLSRLGNLRIEVDDQILYDGPIESWFSGKAQHLTPDLQNILVWRYGLFGSDGNIIPIPYQQHIKVSVYGGPDKPKWFMATGVTLPSGTVVKPLGGDGSDFPVDKMALLAQNVSQPEDYIQSIASPQEYSVTAQPDSPINLVFQGTGTLAAVQFKLLKSHDLSQLWLRVFYGDQVGIELPLLAFFGQPDQVVAHHSTPVGIVDTGDSYLFYSNWPMPYQNGMRFELMTRSTDAIPVQIRVVAVNQAFGTQLRVFYDPDQKLETYGPDYKIDIPGDGKMVGLVLVTGDQGFDSIPKTIDSKTGKEDATKLVWPMGYLEGNLAITDGADDTRYYSGQEDWAEGGYYFNSGYTTPPGGSNRPFAGILRYSEGKDGYATLFRYFNDLSAFRFRSGLHLSFGHGTWDNNFPVTYRATLFYYWQVPGFTQTPLPANDHVAKP